ncbi:NAD(P)/FAD-dependent oxidoreductase [Pedobacter frigoris]|uniref:FAD-dependent oxidoreductase n=1 Tax=Pedobacter frigoris TaxID=2571272 RepID=A0A4U1CT97_9SPHI|nr:FAD-dependent oxidoreductase [Pedobacter frigoris]TKC08958.1 FAD-dependent oxidoreductase [Pedobacter frigoris]
MRAVVIGGGIIGLFSAYYLNREGYEVTIIDKGDLSANSSLGNLGMVVPSHFIPLASPGIVAKGLKWLTNSRSPFYIRPSLSLDLVSWGLKFVKNANQKKCDAAAPYLKDYNLFSKQLFQDLAKEPDFDFFYHQNGILMYYNTEEGEKEEVHVAKIAQDMGLDVGILSPSELQKLEPDQKLKVLGAAHYRCDAHLNPNLLNAQLRTYLISKGVKIIKNKKINGFEYRNDVISKAICDGEAFEADQFILSPGAWMKEVADLLHINIPMMPGKGYTFNVENKPEMKIPAILCEARVAITPMGDKIRFGGTMELGKMNAKVNMNRVEGIVNSIPKYFENIDLAMPDEKDVWYGFRPCSPDGLPYLGHAYQYKNLIIAGGHSMMGLSLAPATGKMVAELATNRKTTIDLRLFSPDRYN